MKTKLGKWIDELAEATGKFVRLETTSGTVREGRLTALRTKLVKMNGVDRDIVNELELNGDPADVVAFVELSSIDIK